MFNAQEMGQITRKRPWFYFLSVFPSALLLAHAVCYPGEMLMVYYLAAAYNCVGVHSGMHLPAQLGNVYQGHN